MTVKVIGKFQEIDGAEFSSIRDLINSKGLIGSTSADVGSVELYYDDHGNTFAVAHDSEVYYGHSKKRHGLSSIIGTMKDVNNISMIIIAGLTTMYYINKYRNSKKKRDVFR